MKEKLARILFNIGVNIIRLSEKIYDFDQDEDLSDFEFWCKYGD